MKNKKLFNYKMKNKKAQEAATLTWIVATILIFLIMFIYIVIVGLWAAQQKLTLSQPKITKEKIQQKSDLILTQNFLSFLNSPVEIKGETTKVRELIKDNLDANKNKYEKFKEEAEGFLNKIPIGLGINKKYARGWIRIYDKDEKIQQYPIGKYAGDYESIKFEGPLYCNPLNEKSITLDIFIQSNKKIALCLEKNDNYKK